MLTLNFSIGDNKEVVKIGQNRNSRRSIIRVIACVNLWNISGLFAAPNESLQSYRYVRELSPRNCHAGPVAV